MKDSENLGLLIARNIKLIREHRKISQSQLAKRAGLPKSTISHLESGSSNPSVQVLRKVTTALSVSFEEVLSRPAIDVQHVPASEMPRVQTAHGGRLTRVLPDPFPEVDYYYLEIDSQSSLIGTPQNHRAPRILFCVSGKIELHLGGEVHVIHERESLLFPGEESHSFHNSGVSQAKAFLIHSRKFLQSMVDI